MKLRDLWLLCEEVIESFDHLPSISITTSDQHIEECLCSYADAMQPDEVLFVREVASGVFHHRKLVEQTLAAYCAGLKKNKTGYITIYIITYLAIFRVAELGAAHFQQLLNKCASNNKIAEYLEFLLSPTHREQFLFPHLTKHYADAYVTDVIFGTMDENRDVLESVAAYYRQKASGAAAAAASVSGGGTTTLQLAGAGATSATTVTTAKGASTTAPKLRPTIVSRAPTFSQTKSKDTSAGLPPAEIRELTEVRPPVKFPRIADTCTDEERACVAAAKYGEKRSTLNPTLRDENREREKSIKFFAFSPRERPSDMPRLLEEQKTRDEESKKPDYTSRPGPEQVRAMLAKAHRENDVRTTTANLLREDIIYRRRQEEEELALKRKAKELRDDSEFQAWRQRELEKERIEQAARVKQRKLDLMLADEEARTTRDKQTKINQVISKNFKADMNVWRKRFAKEEANRVEEQRENAAQLREDLRIKYEKAMKKVTSEKNTAAAQLKREKQDMELKVAVHLELEKERKAEVIKQIKEIHAESVILREVERKKKRHIKAVDIGQLVSMTADELQAKLVEVNAERDAITAEKRAQINDGRDRAKSERQSMIDRIFANRGLYRQAKDVERDQKRAQIEVEKDELRLVEEKRLFELQKKLSDKRDERKGEVQKRREEERQRKVAAQLLSADANAVEMHKWEEMERGAQNTIVLAQNNRLRENAMERKKQQGIYEGREKNIGDALTTHQAFRNMTDTLLDTKRSTAAREAQLDNEALRRALPQMSEERKMEISSKASTRRRRVGTA